MKCDIPFKKLALAVIFLLLPTLASAYVLDGLKDDAALKDCLGKSDIVLAVAVREQPGRVQGSGNEVYLLDLSAGEMLYNKTGLPLNLIPKPDSDLQFILSKEDVAGINKGDSLIIFVRIEYSKMPYFVFSDARFGIQNYTEALAESIKKTTATTQP